MQEDEFTILKHRISKFELSKLPTAEEWSLFNQDALRLMNCPELETKLFAIERLQKALWSEAIQVHRQAGYSASHADSRLLPILNAIASQGGDAERCLLRFCAWSSLSPEHKLVLSEWLSLASTRSVFSLETILIANLQAGLYPPEDWLQCREHIEPFVDHPNDLLRAAAGHAFADLYSSCTENLPPLDRVLDEMKQREIDRPGIAGPFIGVILMNSHNDGLIDGTTVDPKDWILEIIAKRKSKEPDVPFYNGIDFHAHELLSMDSSAVRKLIDFGAEEVAAMAATEENKPVDGMQNLLEILAQSKNDLVCRVCSWHLAYYYEFLHNEGARRGYVEVVEPDDVKIFLVFDPERLGDRPYAATLYPTGETITDEVAWRWIDLMVPPAVRPSMDDNNFPYKIPKINSETASYYFGPYIFQLSGDTKNKLWRRVWVKYPQGKKNW